MNKLSILLLVLLLAFDTDAQIISTIAGTGVPGNDGDGGPATSGHIQFPYGITKDRMGNIFIACESGYIRKIDTFGTITTLAGQGGYDYTGDGGTATDAAMKLPTGVAVDESGNVYIADLNNDVVRKVDVSGIITTIAGLNCCPGYSGDGGPATAAQLYRPKGVTIDGDGNLYIADQTNSVIRKINSAGVIYTIAGRGQIYGHSGDGAKATSATLNLPASTTFDPFGNLVIADDKNNAVRKIDKTSGKIATIAGSKTNVAGYSGDGGPATAALLNNTTGIAFDAIGNMYIADEFNNRIRKVDTSGIITTIAGTGIAGYSGDGGPATAAQLDYPIGIMTDGTNIYFTELNNCVVRKITMPPTRISKVASLMTNIRLHPNPSVGEFYVTGNISVLLSNKVRLQIVDISGRVIRNEIHETYNGKINIPVDLHSVSPGVYSVNLMFDDAFCSLRAVISK